MAASYEYDITYYGTGLALATVVLEDGIRVDLRRPPSSTTWWAKVELEDDVVLYESGESPDAAIEAVMSALEDWRA